MERIATTLVHVLYDTYFVYVGGGRYCSQYNSVSQASSDLIDQTVMSHHPMALKRLDSSIKFLPDLGGLIYP